MLAASVLAFTSCEEEKVSAEITIPDARSQELFKSGINFSAAPAEGDLTVKLSFTSALEWTASVQDADATKAPSWLTVSPSSGPAGVAEITVSAQENTGEEERSAKVTVSSGDVFQSVVVTQAGAAAQVVAVTSLELDKTEAKMTVGETLLLIPAFKPDNVTDKTVTWSSSNPQVASVTGEEIPDATGNPMPAGKVTAVGEGEAVITAKAGDCEAQCKVLVVKNGDGKIEVTEMALNKTELNLKTGESEQLEVVKMLPENATDKTVVWESSNTDVAVVTPKDRTGEDGSVQKGGLVTAKNPGEAVITARAGVTSATCKVIVSGDGSATVESLTIEPSPLTLAIDEEQILTAVLVPSNAKVNVEWKCDKPEIVALGSISETQAKVQGLAEGKATVTAYAGGKTATCEVTVEGGTSTVIPVESITLNKTELEMTVGQKFQLVATVLPENATYKSDNDLEWTTTDPYNVYVNGGLVTAYGVAEATVTVTSRSNPDVSASCKVTVRDGQSGGGGSTVESASVDPSSITLNLNEEQVLTLVMQPADAEVTIYWESANQYIADVQMISMTQAKVKGVSVGQTTVTVHAGDKTATCEVTVEDPTGASIPVESVSLNKTELSLAVGEQFQLIATVLPENASNKEVVWSSNVQSSKLYIDVNGMVSALAECEATVTVRCKANAYISASCHVTVTGGGSSGSDEEVVDLGLPSGLKWRGWNVGASKPEDYGNYYAWGETTPKTSYTWNNYKYGSSDIYSDSKPVLVPEDDAATANLGDGWRTPKNKEWKELKEKCTWKWTTRNGVNGMQVTGPNGNSIFLPAAGYYRPSLTNKGTYGSYWSATYSSSENALAWDFINSDVSAAWLDRSNGLSVRPVKD